MKDLDFELDDKKLIINFEIIKNTIVWIEQKLIELENRIKALENP